jgi:hypothetical protein
MSAGSWVAIWATRLEVVLVRDLRPVGLKAISRYVLTKVDCAESFVRCWSAGWRN